MIFGPLLLSFVAAAGATIIAGLLGVVVGGALARARFAGRDLVDALLTAPLVLPPTVLGYYLLHVIGADSAIGRAYAAVTGGPLVFSRAAVVLAGVLAALPFVVRNTRAAMEDVDERVVGAAQTLGASPARVFFTVLLPLSKGGVVAGLTLGFARALGDFGVTLMVAGDIPGVTQTGALAVYDAVQANDHARAAGMAAVMAAVAVAALVVATRVTRRAPHVW